MSPAPSTTKLTTMVRASFAPERIRFRSLCKACICLSSSRFCASTRCIWLNASRPEMVQSQWESDCGLIATVHRHSTRPREVIAHQLRRSSRRCPGRFLVGARLYLCLDGRFATSDRLCMADVMNRDFPDMNARVGFNTNGPRIEVCGQACKFHADLRAPQHAPCVRWLRCQDTKSRL